MALFSKTVTELMKLSVGKTAEEVEADFIWFMGHNGIVRGLRTGELVTVPVLSAADLTDAQKRYEVQREALSMFCTCFGDDEAMEKFEEAKLWVPAMRKFVTDAGVVPTVPIVRLIDPARHLPFNMKIAARHCGSCVDDFNYMRGWQYDGCVTECDGRNKFLVFGAPFIVPDSTNWTMGEQENLLKDMSKKIGVPKLIHGSAALGALVALSHFHETGGELNGQRLPVGNILARTGTKSDGVRLGLEWDGDGRLLCGRWFWVVVDNRHVVLGCFALGVVELGH
ncbi:hypothetical protein KJ785_01060 [Patescibacteria group bacterium]|nr:hypothetical protein [Patescibacteria group bacterium]